MRYGTILWKNQLNACGLSRIFSSCAGICMSTNAVSHISYMIKACAISLRPYSYRIWWRFLWSYFSFLRANKLNYIYTRGYYLHQSWFPAPGTARCFVSATTPLGSAFQEREAAVGCSEWLRGILLGQIFLFHSTQCDRSSSNLCLSGEAY